MSNGGPGHYKSKICLWKSEECRIDETGSNGVGESSSDWDRIKEVQLAKSSKLPIKHLRSPSINRGSSNRGGTFKPKDISRVSKGENVYLGSYDAMWSMRSR